MFIYGAVGARKFFLPIWSGGGVPPPGPPPPSKSRGGGWVRVPPPTIVTLSGIPKLPWGGGSRSNPREVWEARWGEGVGGKVGGKHL